MSCQLLPPNLHRDGNGVKTMNSYDQIETINFPRFIAKLGELGVLDELTGTAKYLLMCMATFCKWETTDAGHFGDVGFYNETLARKTGLPERTLRNALKALVDAELVQRKEFRTNGGFRRRTTYNIFPAVMLAKAGTAGRATDGRSERAASSRSSSSSQDISSQVEDNPPTPLAADAASSPGGDGRGSTYTKEFETFWSAYPRKVGKKAAFRVWKAAKRQQGWPGLAVILGALYRHSASPGWTKDGGQFIPHPRTWLNQGRWDDETTEAKTKEQLAYEADQEARSPDSAAWNTGGCIIDGLWYSEESEVYMKHKAMLRAKQKEDGQ